MTGDRFKKAVKGWKWLNMARNGLIIAGNGYIWLEIACLCLIWLETDGNDWKWLEAAENS